MTEGTKVHKVVVTGYTDESEEQALARHHLDPSYLAAQSIADMHLVPVDEFHLQETINELRERGKGANRSDLHQLESMLVSQSHTLDAMFNGLLWKANKNLRAGYVDAGERFMRLALKAQSQCRATIESLAEIKNPKAVAFVQQANITAGPQQVNNGPGAPADRSRTGARNSNPSNELLEAGGDDNRLECRTQGTAGFGDPSLATVAEVIGAEVGQGQGPLCAEQPEARGV